MKKIIMLILLLAVLAPVSQATDVSAVFIDTFSVEDTIAAATELDSIFSGWFPTGDYSRFQFYLMLKPYENYAVPKLTNDTFFIEIQHSFDRYITWPMKIDTLLDTSTVGLRDEFQLIASDSVIGEWMRLVLIHWDETEADSPDSVDLIRAVRAVLYITGRQY